MSKKANFVSRSFWSATRPRVAFRMEVNFPES
jgi:hypothetical protein